MQDISQEQAKQLLLAVKAMNQIEEILVDVTRSRPHWTHLLMAVDARVEKALGILRPQVLSNHRILLASLGWPPSLSTSSTEKGKCLEIPNPLALMQGEKKEKYSQSFLKLCALQHLEVRRTARQHDLLYEKEYKLSDSADISKQLSFRNGLWSIDELVKPIASRMEYHFSQWSDEPKFIFALVYKTTRDFLDGVDNVLQPLIDKAELVGCSAKEAWVSAMVKMLSNYLERQFFPSLAMNYDGSAENMVLNSLWVHLLDLMINFDKKMRALATSGTPLMGPFAYFEGHTQSELLLSIFDEHPDWLQIWAEVELKDAQQKLSSELADERSWLIGTQDGLTPDVEAETFLLSTREDYKAPLIADSVVRISWAMMERGQSLPSKTLRIQFIMSSANLFLNNFFIVLLQRCEDMDFITAILEDNDLLTAVGSINTARYCESVLQEWNEDISILDMADNNQHPKSSFFEDEIMFLVKLETDYLVEIVSAILLQFDALSLDYIHGVEQWAREQTKSEDQMLENGNMSISSGFIEALDMLRDRLRILNLNLNPKDFLDLWRSTAGGLDHFIFTSILGNVKFSRHGVDQFKADLRALFLVFKPFCTRPEAFFPCTSDSLKLLAMNWKDADYLLELLPEGKRFEECLRSRGLFHVSVGQAEKILNNRKFEG